MWMQLHAYIFFVRVTYKQHWDRQAQDNDVGSSPSSRLVLAFSSFSATNECHLERTDGCQHFCHPGESSYVCSCAKGYKLGKDHKSCSPYGEFSRRQAVPPPRPLPSVTMLMGWSVVVHGI